MLQYFNLVDITEHKHVIRLTTSGTNEFDISKKFVKFDKRTSLWYFTKLVYSYQRKQTIPIITFLEPNKVYIVELSDKTVETSSIAMIKDLMSVDEIDVWRGIADHAKESYRS